MNDSSTVCNVRTGEPQNQAKQEKIVGKMLKNICTTNSAYIYNQVPSPHGVGTGTH
jgi:hypothetical protein